MRKNIFIIFAIFLALMVLFISPLFSAAYMQSSVQHISPGILPSGFSNSGGQWVSDRTKCEEGQDFIVQIPPFGCEPLIVRSDLLEEQNVPVLCKLSATQMNPFINVEAIDSITFSGNKLPKEISGVGFFPAQAALGVKTKLNSPVLENIGYVVIVFKKQPNASMMPDLVSGNLTATLKYNIKEAYGLGDSRFYLPEISDDSSWESLKSSYGFWNGRGYLRANGLDSESAKISIYTDTKKIEVVNLNKGETSNEIYLPGFDCLVGAKLKLEDLTSVSTKAVLRVNGDVIQVHKGEKFLDNKCTLKNLESVGLNNNVEISCKEDEELSNFKLVLTPRLNLRIRDSEKSYGIGDYIDKSEIAGIDSSAQSSETKPMYTYVGYIGTLGNSGKLEDSYILLVATTQNFGNKLPEDKIAEYSGRAENLHKGSMGGPKIFEWFDKAGGRINEVTKVFNDKNKDTQIEYIYYSKPNSLFEPLNYFVSIVGFASPVDSSFEEGENDFLKYYSSASQDYSKVIDSFSGEEDPVDSEVILGKTAFSEMIQLSYRVGQHQKVKTLCETFELKYPENFREDVSYSLCKDTLKLSSSTSSEKEVFIGSKKKVISLIEVREPSFEEYGVKLRITYQGDVKVVDLTKGKPYFIDQVFYEKDSEINSHKNAYIQLESIDKDTITVKVQKPKDFQSEVVSFFMGDTKTLKKGTQDTLGTPYIFDVVEIYEKKEAKVSVVPSVNKQKTEANFSFAIGIEKRSIELSPEKTKQKIDNLNKTILEWKEINDKLTKVVEGMKTACLATGLALTVKNLANNVGGQSIARQKVMLGEGGWNAKCQEMVFGKNKVAGLESVEQCIMKNADEIDRDVERATQILSKQNEEIEKIQAGCENKEAGLFFEKVMDTECVKGKLAPVIAEELEKSSSLSGKNFTLNGENVEFSKIISLIKNKEISVEEMRNIQYYARLSGEDLSVDLANKELEKNIFEVYSVNKKKIEIESILSGAGDSSLSGEKTPVAVSKDFQTLSYFGNTYGAQNKVKICDLSEDILKEDLTEDNLKNSCYSHGIEESTPIQDFIFEGKYYYATLDNLAGSKFGIKSLYVKDGNSLNKVSDNEFTRIRDKFTFEKKDSSSLVNLYLGSLGSNIKYPLLKCYETEPYKGYPAIAPVDTTKGWYAAISQNLPVSGNIASYQDSGRVSSFYICNVGKNGIEENRGGDDDCTMVNLNTGQYLGEISGLNNADSLSLIKEAVTVIQAAQQKCLKGRDDGIFKLGNKAKNVRMGPPAANSPDIECYNFMSPNDCKILFNVCDPVICPNSRCDFGGKYRVPDVVQSGIVGGLLLCAPNSVLFEGDVYIPFCLSGIKAGIDGYLSVAESYRDCLQTNLETGQMTGICDQIYSVHLCELVWRQALPLAKMIIPKTLELLMGKSVRGGGEYLSVQDAWNTAGKSAEYFARYYSTEAFASFQTKMTQGITDQVCKTYISGAYPDGGKILDSLTNADSPPQYHGSFQEIKFTTATNPPISHYKVYYHIYAGQKSRAYYQVYLKGALEGSYYEDASTRYVVATGYLDENGKETQTKDFTAVSGYKEMCIVVNGKEECGFQNAMISTSFALDFLADQYIKEQANQTGITSESTCVSGTSSVWSLVSSSPEGAVNELANPQIYNRGIIRICATNNPGSSTDKSSTEQRWIEVGYCGDKNLKCWLDKESVKSAANFNYTSQSVLDNLDKLSKLEQNFMTDENFLMEIEKIEKQKDALTRIKLIEPLFQKVYKNSQKGKLYLLRGKAFGELSQSLFKKIVPPVLQEEVEICVSKDPKIKEYLNLIAMKESHDLSSTYYSNSKSKEFIEGIFSRELITEEEYDFIIGAAAGSEYGYSFILTPSKEKRARNMSFVFQLLESKYKEICLGGNSQQISLDSSRQKILNYIKLYEGKIVKNEDASNCYTAVMRVYTDASCVQKTSPCFYSALNGKTYNIRVGSETKEVQMTYGLPFIVSKTSCTYSSSHDYNYVLSNYLAPGDRIDFVFDESAGHSVIFIGWEDKSVLKAKVFDWNGNVLQNGEVDRGGVKCTQTSCKTYSYQTISFKENEHPIYRIWNPKCN